MNEQTRFEQERGVQPGRRLAKVTAEIAQWAQKVSAPAVTQAWRLVGSLNDAIRAGQYDLGMPYLYQKTLELLPGEDKPLLINVRKYGVIQDFIPMVSNIENTPTDRRLEAGVTRVEIGAQTFFISEENTLFRPTEIFASGFVPQNGGGNMPQNFFGFLRRIPIAQGDTIQVICKNFSTNDTYQVGITVVQYGMLPPNLVNPQ